MKPKPDSGPDELNVSRLITITRKAFTRGRRSTILAILSLCLGIIVSGFIILAAAEQYAWFGSAVKITFLTLVTIAAVLTGIRCIRHAGANDFEQFYLNFSRFASLPSLRNAFDLALHRRDSKLKLYNAALSHNLRALDEEDLTQKLNAFLKSRSEHKRAKTHAAFLALTLCVLSGLVLLLPDAAWRTLHAWNSYEAPNPYTYAVEPGHVTVEQGSALAPVVIFSDKLPEEISLAFKTDVEEEYRMRPVSQINRDTVRFNPVTLNTNGSYYIVMDGFQSSLYTAKVQLRPRFEFLEVQVVPPPYTGLDSTTYSYPFSQIKAYQGSRLILNGIPNKELSELTLIRRSPADTLALNPEGDNRFVHSLEVSEQDTLSFVMRDTSGLTNKNLFGFTISPVPDESPFVQIVQPDSNIKMKEPRELELRYEASDDFGLTSAHLRYELQHAFSDNPEKGSVPLQIPQSGSQQQHMWDLKELNPRPRDVITYLVEVSDNNGFGGSQSARSQTLTITFPSLTEFLDQIEDRENDVTETLDEVSDSHREIRDSYERFKEQLKEHPQGNWEQRQTLDAMKEQQQKLDQKVEELNRKFEEIRQELNENSLMSGETLKAYSELQQLMKEIDDPELLRALEELQNALGSMDQQQMREAMENFEFNEQKYQERIQRTIELFKTLKLNSNLEKMAAALEELARQEEELMKSTDSTGNSLKKQKSVREDTRNLSDDLNDLTEHSPERSREDIRRLQDESNRQLQEVGRQLDENIRQMEQQADDPGQSGEIQNQQQKIQKQFRQMAQQMRSARQQLSRQRNQVNASALQYILYSLITLSQNQEELTQETERLNNRSQAFVEKARIQQSVAEQFSRLSDSLFQVSAEIPRFSNKINEKKMVIQQHLASSVEMMAERNRSQSAFAGRQSLGGINELSTMIASLLEQLQNQQQGSGGQMSMQQFMEQLQQMSGQQQMMNQQIQELINDIQGDRLSNDQVERLNQLARQQNQIRQQLRELQENGGLEAGDQMLSELERISEQMEETINDLRGGQTENTLIKRQQNILSRMLNAERALNERGKEDKREGTVADDGPRSTPPDVTLEELEKEIRKMLNDPNYTRFSQDYQKLIEQYFELLRELEDSRES